MNTRSDPQDNLNWIEIFLEEPINYLEAKAAFKKNFLSSVFDANEYQRNLILNGMKNILAETILEFEPTEIGTLSVVEPVFTKIIKTLYSTVLETYNAWLLRNSNFEKLVSSTDNALLPFLIRHIKYETSLHFLTKTNNHDLKALILDGIAYHIYQNVLVSNFSDYKRIDRVTLQRHVLNYISSFKPSVRFNVLMNTKDASHSLGKFFTDASCIRLINKKLENLIPERLTVIASATKPFQSEKDYFIIHLANMLEDTSNELFIADMMTRCEDELLNRFILYAFLLSDENRVKLIKIIEKHTHQISILQKLSFMRLEYVLKIVNSSDSIQPYFIARIVQELAKKLISSQQFLTIVHLLNNTYFQIFIDNLDIDQLPHLITFNYMASIHKNMCQAEIFLKAFIKHKVSLADYPSTLQIASDLYDDTLFLDLLSLIQGNPTPGNIDLGEWLTTTKECGASKFLIFCLQLDEKTIFKMINMLTLTDLFYLNEKEFLEELIQADIGLEPICDHIKKQFEFLLDVETNSAYQKILIGDFSRKKYHYFSDLQLFEKVMTKIFNEDPNQLGPVAIYGTTATLINMQDCHSRDSILNDWFTMLMSKLNFDSLSHLLNVHTAFHRVYGKTSEYIALVENFSQKAYPLIKNGSFQIEEYFFNHEIFILLVFNHIFTLPLEEQRQALLESLTENKPLNHFMKNGKDEGIHLKNSIRNQLTKIEDQLNKQKLSKELNEQRFRTFLTVFDQVSPANNNSFESLDMVALQIKENPEGIEDVCMSVADQIIPHANGTMQKIELSETALSLVSANKGFSQLFPKFSEALKKQNAPEPSNQTMTYYSFFSVSALKEDAEKRNEIPITHTSDDRYIGKSVLNH